MLVGSLCCIDYLLSVVPFRVQRRAQDLWGFAEHLIKEMFARRKPQRKPITDFGTVIELIRNAKKILVLTGAGDGFGSCPARFCTPTAPHCRRRLASLHIL
jgi:hypothetical protein